MVLEEKQFSVLIVSSSEKFNNEMDHMLSKAVYASISFSTSISAARRMLSQRQYDLIIVNSPLPDDFGSSFSVDCSQNSSSVVLQLVKSDFYSEVTEKALPHGVFTLIKPISKQSMLTALNWMKTASHRLKKIEKKSTSIEEKMQEIRLVNKAKWLLISNEGLDEPSAHKKLEKEAMDRCVSKGVIANEIISKYS